MNNAKCDKFWQEVAEQRKVVAMELLDEVILLKQHHDQLLEACKADAFLVELAEQAIASAITPTDILQKKLLEVNAQRLAAIEAAERKR